MQTWRMENDVPLFGIETDFSPHGVRAAWEDLHKLLPTADGRVFYGVSHQTASGGILYKACVREAFSGEAESLGLKPFVLPKGDYIGKTIHGFMAHLPKIGETFRSLLALNDHDPNGACIEWYLNGTDAACMIRRKGQD